MDRQIDIATSRAAIAANNSIIDGADKVRNTLYRKTVNRNVLSFAMNCTSFKKLHIDGANFYANCKV